MRFLELLIAIEVLIISEIVFRLATCLMQAFMVQVTLEEGILLENVRTVPFSSSLALNFHDVDIVHLPNMNSDHRPLWVCLAVAFTPKNPKPFRFILSWLNGEGFDQLVSHNWNRNALWSDNVTHFSQVASAWNHEIFGNIHKRKSRLINRLHGVQCASLNELNPNLEELQSKLWLDYETVLFEEETLWFQKSMCKWISIGDRNTKYFHLSTLARRRRNCILALRDALNAWVHDLETLKLMVKDSFIDLYCEHS